MFIFTHINLSFHIENKTHLPIHLLTYAYCLVCYFKININFLWENYFFLIINFLKRKIYFFLFVLFLKMHVFHIIERKSQLPYLHLIEK